jgi:ABC-type nitrate/sulfonate/bicarbonate transport system permease component
VEIAFPALVVVALWVASLNSGSFFFPPVPLILEQLVTKWLGPFFVPQILPSLGRMFLGLGIAVVLGIVLGILLGRSTTARRIATPVTEFFRAIPPPAVIPFTILVFGIGDPSKVFLIAGVCVFPILLNTIDGVVSVEPVIRETTQVYRIRPVPAFFRVTMASAAPQIMAGIRTSLSLALILMVVSEMVASSNGIGMQLIYAQRTFAIADMWAGIVLLGILGYLLNLGFGLVERRILRWHRESKRVSE